MAPLITKSIPDLQPAFDEPCWGTQIGGIQDLSETPERWSADHQDRIEDFMKRHDGPAPAASRQGCIDAGYRGLSAWAKALFPVQLLFQ
jgi:hypothetical protein